VPVVVGGGPSLLPPLPAVILRACRDAHPFVYPMTAGPGGWQGGGPGGPRRR
jgi:hypothetical protein